MPSKDVGFVDCIIRRSISSSSSFMFMVSPVVGLVTGVTSKVSSFRLGNTSLKFTLDIVAPLGMMLLMVTVVAASISSSVYCFFSTSFSEALSVTLPAGRSDSAITGMSTRPLAPRFLAALSTMME